MKRITLAVMLILLLTACNGGYIPLVVASPISWPSPLPAILSPTPPFIPSATPKIISIPTSTTINESSSATPTVIFTSTPTIIPTVIFTSTFTPTTTLTSTFTSTPTNTPPPTSDLSLEILGCNTSLDILHQMGEVTNAYPIVRNFSDQNLTNVCATLSASDEARVHPDKTVCVVILPAGYQVTLKLTIDTGAGEDTAIQVVASTTEGLAATASRSSCLDIGLPGWLPDKVGVIEPIQ